ncbi:MAG: hypothetical protein ACM3NH_02765 [Candidatus Saccharibacteria bacterium]
MPVFDSWGYQLKEVLPENSLDRLLPAAGPLARREPGWLNPTD